MLSGRRILQTWRCEIISPTLTMRRVCLHSVYDLWYSFNILGLNYLWYSFNILIGLKDLWYSFNILGLKDLWYSINILGLKDLWYFINILGLKDLCYSFNILWKYDACCHGLEFSNPRNKKNCLESKIMWYWGMASKGSTSVIPNWPSMKRWLNARFTMVPCKALSYQVWNRYQWISMFLFLYTVYFQFRYLCESAL